MNFSLYFKIFSYIPTVNLFSLLLLILHAYFLHGHMPTYSNPDPNELGFTYLFFIIITMFLMFSFFIYPILITMVIFKKYLKTKTIFIHVIIYGASVVLLLALYRLKSLGLGDWIAD